MMLFIRDGETPILSAGSVALGSKSGKQISHTLNIGPKVPKV
jgi:hypothetical protein